MKKANVGRLEYLSNVCQIESRISLHDFWKPEWIPCAKRCVLNLSQSRKKRGKKSYFFPFNFLLSLYFHVFDNSGPGAAESAPTPAGRLPVEIVNGDTRQISFSSFSVHSQ